MVSNLEQLGFVKTFPIAVTRTILKNKCITWNKWDNLGQNVLGQMSSIKKSYFQVAAALHGRKKI